MIIEGANNSVFQLVADYGDDTMRYLNTFRRGLHTWMLPTEEGWQKLSKVATLAPRELIEYDMTYRRDYNWWAPLIVAISSINPAGATVITGCDALIVENIWFEYTTSNKHEPAAPSHASPLEWFQAMWLLNFDGIAREVDEAEVSVMSKLTDSRAAGQDNPRHISDFFGRVAGILNGIRPLAEYGIKYGTDAIASATGDPNIAAAAKNIAMGLLNGATAYHNRKRR